jgi:hypothetical protein
MLKITGITTLYGIREQSSRCTVTYAVGRSVTSTVMGGLISMAKTPTFYTANVSRKGEILVKEMRLTFIAAATHAAATGAEFCDGHLTSQQILLLPLSSLLRKCD